MLRFLVAAASIIGVYSYQPTSLPAAEAVELELEKFQKLRGGFTNCTESSTNLLELARKQRVVELELDATMSRSWKNGVNCKVADGCTPPCFCPAGGHACLGPNGREICEVFAARFEQKISKIISEGGLFGVSSLHQEGMYRF